MNAPQAALATSAALAATAWARDAAGSAAAQWVARVCGLPDDAQEAHTAAPGAHAVDAILDAAWRDAPDAQRRQLGRVWTPRAVARQLLLEVGYGQRATTGHLVDPACGGGIFLGVAAAMSVARRMAEGHSPSDAAHHALTTVHGIDIDPQAVALARAVIAAEVVVAAGPDVDPAALPTPSVHCADACTLPAADPLGVGPFEWVVGNPPYLEAKRMPRPQRDALRARWGKRLHGAWDLYMAFLEWARDATTGDAHIGFVLPNKIQVARYAERFRADTLARGQLRAIVDLSELPVFKKVGVYPVLLALGPGERTCRAAWKVDGHVALGQAPLANTTVPYALLEATGDPPVWFTVPDAPTSELMSRVLRSGTRLGDLADIRSTCSFHKKGLREQYIGTPKADTQGLPYLGGTSFARRNEVRPFRIEWTGARIDYDEAALKAVGNPLPPRARFLRPKIVYCQHARGVVAAPDPDGQYVTKDVYPIALPRESTAEAVFALTGLMNSRTFSALYSLCYRGIQIGGRYLHILPVYLRQVPVPAWSPATQRDLAQRTQDVLAATEEDARRARFDALDTAVADAYGLTPDDRARLHAYADSELGFDAPILERT